MNKDLYGKQYQIPPHILGNLKNCASNETIGNLLKTGKISYSLIKKCIHRMENGEKDTLGGDTFYNWLKQTLNSDRNGLNTSKQIKADAGISNAHIKSHEKGDLRTMNRPSQSHSKQNAELKITESLKRINEIISKLI